MMLGLWKLSLWILVLEIYLGYADNCGYFFELVQGDKIVLSNATDNDVESLASCLSDKTLILRMVVLQSVITMQTLVTSMPDRARQTISVIVINNSDMRTIPGDILVNLTNLHSIDFARNTLTNLEQNAFNAMDKVSSIDLSYNNLTEISAGTFTNLPNLVELKLNGNKLAFISPNALSNLPELDVLYLDHNELREIPYDAFQNSPIEYWHIANNRIEVISSKIGQFSHLVSLDVSGNYLKSVNWKLSTLHHLEKLFLDNNSLSALPDKMSSMFENRSAHITLRNNLWHCDCDLLWLISFHQKGLLLEDLNCTTPQQMNMNEFFMSDLLCQQATNSSGFMGYKVLAVILSVILTIGVFLAFTTLYFSKYRARGIKRPIRMILNGQYYRPRSIADSTSRTRCTNTLQYTNFDGHETSTMKTICADFMGKKQFGALRLGPLIGRGAFGDVFEGFASGADDVWRKVAVKKIRGTSRINDPDALATEYQNFTSIGNHPNIIQLFGTGEINGSMVMVLEFADNGDLLAYLKHLDRTNAKVIQNLDSSEWKAYLQKSHPRVFLFMWHIAKGMEYLSRLKIIHRDLAARNILLSSDHVAKISDFGLSRDVYENGYYYQSSNGRMPYKWMSPESLCDGRYTSKSDVWSFGILLWEIVTLGAGPFPGIPPDMLQNMYKHNYIMPSPPLCPDLIYSIMEECWSFVPERRPDFDYLLEKFDKMLQTVVNKEYLKLCEHGESRCVDTIAT